MADNTGTAAGASAQPIGLGRAIGYGSGDLGFNLFYTGLNLYLLFYYTDVVGIPPAIAGLIFMVPLFWDAITDPIMGAIASRTRTRFGKYRPYILFGGPVLGVSFVMMFAAPVIWPGAAVLAAFLSHIVFRTAYTLVNVPYSALSAAMTLDSRERTMLAGARMQFATLGGIATAFATPRIANALGQGDLTVGYLYTSIVFAIAAGIIFWINFAATREDPSVQSDAPMPIRDSVTVLRSNGAFWILFAAVITGIAGSSISTKALVYYVSYFMEQPDAVSLVLTLSTFMIAVSVVGWTILGRRFSKRTVWLIGGTGSVIGNLALFALAPTDLSVLYGFVAWNGFMAGAFVVMFWSMIPDTVEYGQWKSGIRDEGIVFGLNQFSHKAANGFGVGALGLLLAAIGYVANQPQTPEALEGLRALSFLLPALTGLTSMIIISRYPIDAKLHAQMVAEIAARGDTQKG